MSQQNDIMVTVVVITYNQEKWIRQTLDSILAQETEYPFEVIIGEDHGTDGTRAICREYADKYENVTLLADAENMGVAANWIRCVQAGTGKYIMNCAGDDWWHNPNKIQLQVDFMEAHQECVVCHTDIDEYNETTRVIKHNVKQMNGILPPEGMIQQDVFSGKAHMSAVTKCLRMSAIREYIDFSKYIELGLMGEDYPTDVILSAFGEVRYLPISTATYRIGNVSMTREINYDKIRNRYETEKRQARWLCSMFPNLGLYEDDVYYDKYCSHQLLLTAYRNNDYPSAWKFAKEDKMPNWKTMMARTWLTFQIARWYSNR